MRAVLVMTVTDLRQRVRDKSVLIFALLVPLALMVVFDLTLGSVDDVELGTVTVVVSAPAEDPYADVLVTALADTGVAELSSADDDAPGTAGPRLDEEAARAAVLDGRAGLAVLVPDGFTAALTAGDGPVVHLVEGEGGDLETAVVVTVLEGTLDQLHATAVATAAAAELGAPDARLATLGTEVVERSATRPVDEEPASDEQLGFSGSLVAGQAGLFLLFTVGFGVLGLVTERRQGTMTRLRSMPIRLEQVVLAKALVSVVLGVTATSVLLAVGGFLFDVTFGSVPAVALLVLAVVTAGVSLMFVIARLARTAEQATMVQQILALVLGVAGGAFFPMTATGLAGDLLDLNPVAAFTRGLGITHNGGGVTDLGVPLATMLGFAVVCVLASRLLPDRGAEA